MARKLNSSDIKNSKPRFNTIEALETIIDKPKMPMFTHKAKRVVILAAKDSGKSFPVDVYKTYCMERDPMASILTLMKYSTGAMKRGSRSFKMANNVISRDYSLPHAYEPSTSFMYRKKDKRINLNNQAVEYASFEKSDSLAGYSISNGGYPALIHIEEPSMQGDNDTVSPKQWIADTETITDTVKRHWRDYSLSDRNKRGSIHDPIPFKTIITSNDWDPEHPVSKETEKYFPQKKFLNYVLGFNYYEELELFEDKIDGENIIPEIKEWVDARWEEIKINVVKNNTKFVYVDYNESGIQKDTLYGRMTKFANPVARKDEETKEKVLNDMYRGLITGDTYTLAVAFGMGYGGAGDEDRLFNLVNFRGKDTKKILNGEIDEYKDMKQIGFSIGWDHDANRGPVGTPISLIAKKGLVPNNYGGHDYVLKDYKVLVHEQIIIEGYGKGVSGANTKLYHQQMIQSSKDAYDEYVGDNKLEMGSYAIFDDDDGSYVYKMAEELRDFKFNWVDALPNKNGTIENGGFGVVSRDKMFQVGINSDSIIVDIKNNMLIDWFRNVPFVSNTTGDKKRSTDGKWGKRYKDISNSAEYGIWPFRFHIL